MDNGNAKAVGLAAPQVVPLLQQLNRVEEAMSALAMRLDPITNHTPTSENQSVAPSSSVTGRLTQLGDTLQYLLENIEL